MPLEFTVFHITNRSQGGNPGYAIACLLNDAQRDFGSAVQTIEITLHHEGSVNDDCFKQSMDGPAAEIAAMFGGLSAPPAHYGSRSARFERKRSKLKIDYISSQISADEVFPRKGNTLSLDVFHRGFDAAIAALSWGTSERITRSDDFDAEACLAWMKTLRNQRYASNEEMQKTVEAARRRGKERHDAKDPWEKLDIDWDTMHPDARSILDDPEDWSQGHEFSPHGNDAGADIFADWERFRGLHPFEAGARMELPRLKDDLPDYIWKEWVDVHLAMAFGHIKKEGLCPTKTASATIAIIDREAKAKADLEWEHRDEWLERLARYRGILERYV